MKKQSVKLSEAGLQRLPRYYRCLRNMIGEDILRVSSEELAAQLGLSAALVRQDLRCLGGMGQQGYGYNVKDLYTRVGEMLGISDNFGLILVGCSDFDIAFSGHPLFSSRGICLRALFDLRAEKTSECGNLTRYPIAELEAFCRENRPRVAVLAVPYREAQTVAARLEACGIDAIWNLTGARIQTARAIVRDLNLLDSLLELTCILHTSAPPASPAPPEMKLPKGNTHSL